MPIYLIRHAHAGTRHRRVDAPKRALSTRGRAQAAGVCDLLGTEPIGRLFSSPSRRCVETLEPLAALLGLPIETVPALDEGSSGKEAERFLSAHAGQNPAACSHGDVIPKVLSRLRASGLRTGDDTVAATGSVWVLHVGGQPAATGVYHPPAD